MISNVSNTICRVLGCEYNVNGFCGLNVKSGSDVIEEQCSPTNNWHIIGSFVLDQIFQRDTAKDIDLVMPEHEMPVALSNELINSDLVIEMVWRSPVDLRGFDFYNISLPRISERGFEECQIAEELKRYKKIQTLRGVRKVPALSFFSAIKTMAKYDLEPNTKTLKIWRQSILSPLAWKKELGYFFLKYTAKLTGRRYQWDYMRAEYLISRAERVYETTVDREKEKYLKCVREVLLNLQLQDIAYEALLKYVNAKVQGDIERINHLWRDIMDARFEQKRERSV
jgi:hypothetical protein